MTVDNFNLVSAPPNSLVTISTSLGTVRNTDVDPDIEGVQVLTNGAGQATILLQRPSGKGTAVVSLDAVNGEEIGVVGIDFSLSQTRKFDFNNNQSPTYDAVSAANTDGYVGVITSNLYDADRGFGWMSQPNDFDDGQLTPVGDRTDLRRDGHRNSGATTFRVDLENGTYSVHVLIGDRIDHSNISIAANGTTKLSGISPVARSYFEGSFEVSVTNGQLDLQFSQAATTFQSNGWLINGLEIRPVGSVSVIAFGANVGAVEADGQTTRTINATATGLAMGELVTVASTSGTITTTDADAAYAGTQVAVGAAGAISFNVLAPTKSATPTITIHSLDGSHQGTANTAVFLDFVIPVTRRLDFNNGSTTATASPTAAGFFGVLHRHTNAAADGFGWTAGVNSFNTNFPLANVTTDDLYRDGHRGGPTFSPTFQVEAKPGVSYDVRTYHGVDSTDLDQIRVTVEGAGTLTAASTTAGNFTNLTFLNARDVNSDGLINVTITDAGGIPTGWKINGLDIAESATGLPSSAPLMSDATATSDTQIVVAAITPEELSTVIEVAINSWLLTDLTGVQRERLQSVSFTIADLSDGILGLAGSTRVLIDDDAAGLGWSTRLDSVDAGRVDLLTAVAHELGHIIGLGDLDPNLVTNDVMLSSLEPGTRHSRLGDIDDFFAQALRSPLPFE